MRNWLKPLFLILLTAAVYRDSFTSRFFQDDKILLGIARSGSPFAVIPNFPFRPISQELFYLIGDKLFDLHPLGYHLIIFAFFAGTVVLIYKLADKLLESNRKAILAAFFYALNISLFAEFFWIATSYFSIGAFFFFLTLWFYLDKKPFLATVAFILALGSNEMALVLPGIFLLVGWYKRFWPKYLWPFLLSLPLLLWLRLQLGGLPKAADYRLVFSPRAFATFRWYLLRALNLPEGVQRSSFWLYGLFAVLLVFLATKTVFHWRPRLMVFGLVFFILGALPFYFLPNHMSSYYLSMALFGPALIFGEVVSGRKATIILCGVYLLLTILGLNFLSQTHWIILKNTGPIGQF